MCRVNKIVCGKEPEWATAGSVARAAAHKVYDFQAVAIAELGRGPGIAAHDDFIEFDRDPIGLDAQLLHHRGQRESVAEATLFAIDLEFHCEHCRRSRHAGKIF